MRRSCHGPRLPRQGWVGSSVASSMASQPRSRSSSLNSTDSGSAAGSPELGRGGPLTSKRFSVISSEDFNRAVVKPLRGKEEMTRKIGALLSAECLGPPSHWAASSPSSSGGAACREYRQYAHPPLLESFHWGKAFYPVLTCADILPIPVKNWSSMYIICRPESQD